MCSGYIRSGSDAEDNDTYVTQTKYINSESNKGTNGFIKDFFAFVRGVLNQILQ